MLMTAPSMSFKTSLLKYDKMSRDRILFKLMNWLQLQSANDPQAHHAHSILQNLCNFNAYQTETEFKTNSEWHMIQSLDNCVSFQEIVRAKLAIPTKKSTELLRKTNEPSIATVKPRRSIPKKIRGLTWKAHFGNSMTGSCFCCKTVLEALDDWHAGHIVAHANGGKDTVDNLRPICISCNLSMGTENMDDFKERCYSL